MLAFPKLIKSSSRENKGNQNREVGFIPYSLPTARIIKYACMYEVWKCGLGYHKNYYGFETLCQTLERLFGCASSFQPTYRYLETELETLFLVFDISLEGLSILNYRGLFLNVFLNQNESSVVTKEKRSYETYIEKHQ